MYNFPVFGYGAKTFNKAQNSSDFFPLSLDLRNPFIANHYKVLDEQYTNCLKKLQISVPVKLSPIVSFTKELGKKVHDNVL